MSADNADGAGRHDRHRVAGSGGIVDASYALPSPTNAPGITATLEWPAGGVEDATGAGVVFPYTTDTYATGTSWKCGITSVANSSMERITFS